MLSGSARLEKQFELNSVNQIEEMQRLVRNIFRLR
jgi:hypothetical protein